MGQRVGKEKVHREKGYLYYVDKEGYISKAKMQHGGRKHKK